MATEQDFLQLKDTVTKLATKVDELNISLSKSGQVVADLSKKLEESEKLNSSLADDLANRAGKEAANALFDEGKIDKSQIEHYAKLHKENKGLFDAIVPTLRKIHNSGPHGSNSPEDTGDAQTPTPTATSAGKETPGEVFLREAEKLAAEQKIEFDVAVQRLADEKPELYDAYVASI